MKENDDKLPAMQTAAAAETGVETPVAGPAGVNELFWCFSSLGLTGFGGVTPWARRILVDRKRWLTNLEFAELLTLGQLLPGSNISNMAIMLGRSYFGWRGAVAAVCGLHMFPLIIIILLGLAYHRYGQLAWVQHLLGGVLPVAAGMVIATAIKLIRGFPRTVHTAGFFLLTFGAAALLHLSLGMILLVLAPLAMATAWRAK